jgi:hypothetical protein
MAVFNDSWGLDCGQPSLATEVASWGRWHKLPDRKRWRLKHPLLATALEPSTAFDNGGWSLPPLQTAVRDYFYNFLDQPFIFLKSKK